MSRFRWRLIAAISLLVVGACSAPGAATSVTPTLTVTPTLLPGQSLPEALTAAARSTSAVTITASPTMQPSPTATATNRPSGGGQSQPQPTSPPTITAVPSIISFTASTDKVNPGDKITLSWQTTAHRVSIRVVLSTGQYGPWFDQPGSGSMDYTVDAKERNGFQIQLVAGSGDSAPYKNLLFNIICPDRWFFDGGPATCPNPVQQGDWVVQKFQHGTMYWIAASGTIVYVQDNNVWGTYTDTWQQGMPELDPGLAPPDGLFQPVRGFGKVWRENNMVSTIGWGTGPEFAASLKYQCDSVYKSAKCYLAGPDGLLVLNIWGGGWKLFEE